MQCARNGENMAQRRIPEDVVNDVRLFWSQNKGNGKSVRRLHDDYYEARGRRRLLSLRKFQQIVAEAIANSPEDPFPLVEWAPWHDEAVTSEDSAYLLKLDALCLAAYGRHLWKHEAKRAQGLRVSLQGLAPYFQFCFVLIYAMRETSAYHLNDEAPQTSDLDLLLAYTPWLSDGHQRVYQKAAISAALPVTLGVSPVWGGEEFEDLLATMEGIDPENILSIAVNWRIVLRMLAPLPTNLFEHDHRTRLHNDWTLSQILDFWAGKPADNIDFNRTESPQSENAVTEMGG